MLLPVAAFSGFLNNTPVVVALMPVANDLAKRISASSSRLLLPMSYAAILGGMCTLIGTSTNLIIADLELASDRERDKGRALNFFFTRSGRHPGDDPWSDLHDRHVAMAATRTETGRQRGG